MSALNDFVDMTESGYKCDGGEGVELAVLREQVEKLMALIQDLEWVVGGYPEPKHRYCMDCGNDEISGHNSDCRIAAALDKGRE